MISAAGGAVFLIADAVANARRPVEAPREATAKKSFLPFDAKIKVTRLGALGADLPRQFDIDRYFLDGRRDVVVMKIADEAVRPDPRTSQPDLRSARTTPALTSRSFIEDAAVRQSDVDGDPRRERTVAADIGLGVENRDDGRAIVEMGVEVPPFIAATLRADPLTVLKLRHLDGGDAKSLVISAGRSASRRWPLSLRCMGILSCDDRSVRSAAAPNFWLTAVDVGEAAPILVLPPASDRGFELCAYRLRA